MAFADATYCASFSYSWLGEYRHRLFVRESALNQKTAPYDLKVNVAQPRRL